MELLFLDRSVAVVVKQPGELSEEAGGDPTSVITLLRQLLSERGEQTDLFPIHRLDRPVGGVMVYARTKQAAAKLSASVQRNELKKEYFAAVHGRPEQASATLTDLLWKDSRKGKTYVVTRQRKGVREASLEYTALRTEGDRSLVRILLHTGRSHQIRVQFASRKLPLIGDGKYGARDNEALALWAFRLSFPHPSDGKIRTFSSVPRELGGISIPEEAV